MLIKKVFLIIIFLGIVSISCKAKEKTEAKEVSEMKNNIEYWVMEDDMEMIDFLSIKPKKNILERVFRCLVVYKPEENMGQVYVPFDKNVYEINIEEKEKNDYFLSNPKNGKKRRLYKATDNGGKSYMLLPIINENEKKPEVIAKKTELGGWIVGYHIAKPEGEIFNSPESYMNYLEESITFDENESGLKSFE